MLPSDDRSKTFFRVLLRLLRDCVPDDVAVELRRQYPNGPFGHYGNDQDVRKDIERAREWARKQGFDASATINPMVAPGEPAIPTISELQDGEEFPVAALGPRLMMAARAAALQIQTPIGLAAMTVLAACGLMAQQHVDVLVFESVRPVSLMALTVAASGERKTAIDDLLLKSVRLHERDEVIRLNAEKEKYRLLQQVFEAQVKAIARKTSLDATAREQALTAIGQPPSSPPEPGVLIDDATIEGLYRQLKRGRVSQGLITAEGGLFIGGHAMKDDAVLRTLAGFSQIWDRGEFNIVRADVERSHHVWGRRFTVGLMAQPEVARRLTGNKLAKEQGTMSRLLVHWPKSAIGTRTHPPTHADETLYDGIDDIVVIDAAIGSFHDTLMIGLAAPIKTDENGAIVCQCLVPDGEAMTELRAFGIVMEERMLNSEAGRSFNNKAPEHALRLAAVLQTYDAIAEAQAVTLPEGIEEAQAVTLPEGIDAVHMRRGIQLARFFAAEAERLMGHEEIDEDTAAAAKLETWLIEKGKTTTTLAELGRFGPGGLRTVRKLRPAIAVLIENGRLRVRAEGADFNGKHWRQAWNVVLDENEKKA
jgi:hypothetical protein